MDKANRNRPIGGSTDVNRTRTAPVGYVAGDRARSSGFVTPQPRGKKDRPTLRDSEPPPSRTTTPKLELQGDRRSSAPPVAAATRSRGSGEGSQSRSSPRQDQNSFEQASWRKGKRSRRRDGTSQGKHFDPVLKRMACSVYSRSQNSIQEVQSRFTYAQALGTQPRQAITTSPFRDVVSVSSTPAFPITSRTRMPSLINIESSQSTISETDQDVSDSAAEDFEDSYDTSTDLSSSTYSDRGLPSDVVGDEPLVNPRAYYRELADLEANTVGRSGLHLLKRANRQTYPTGVFDLKVTFPDGVHGVLTTQFPNYDIQVMRSCTGNTGLSSKRRDAKRSGAVAYWAFHLLECRNLMLTVIANVEEMRRLRYCDVSINYLALDISRTDVVQLAVIQLETIRKFHAALERALSYVVSLLENEMHHSAYDTQTYLDPVTHTAKIILQDCPILQNDFTECTSWRLASILSDLTVLSYCGAHVERFDMRYIQEDLDFAKITTAWTFANSRENGLVLRRRSLQCLGEFLGYQKVWVIQPLSTWFDEIDLWLSTTIHQLADIWGPVWAVKGSSTILRYNAGSGSIVSWPNQRKHPALNEDEIVCHWLPLGERNPEQPIGDDADQILLIGATTVGDRRISCLKENEECQNKTRKVIRQLKSQHLLEEIGTRAGYSELAEESVQLGMGFQGVQLGGQRVYKRRAGVTLKDAICNAWRNKEGNRNPAILEHYLGVEVSFCSRNARRRRLKTILNSTTMRNWLEGCKTNTDPFQCEKAFHEALENNDPYAFRQLWKRHREWRRDLEQLVSWCLDGLRYSSFEQDGTLRALWIPHDDTRYRVKLKNNPHSWTDFLSDSKESCAFVVMSGRCLQSDYKGGATCQTTLHPHSSDMGYPLLETSLVINHRAPKPSGLRLRKINIEKSPHAKRPWRISQLNKGDRFPLESGRLKVIETFASTRLLVDFEGGIVKMLQEATRSVVRAIGQGDEPVYHWELREDDDAATKPIPLFVLSQYELRRS